MAKFSIAELLMKRAELEKLPTDLQANLLTLQGRLNAFFAAYSQPIHVSSGYRPANINSATPNAAPQSKHLTCQAADLLDLDGHIWQFCLANLDAAQRLGIWFEDKRYTPTWIHCQTIAPKSGLRIFKPSAAPPQAPQAWTGQYNAKYNADKSKKA